MKKPRILLVDDSPSFTARLAGAIEGLYYVDICHSEDEFRRLFAVGKYDLLIIDIRLQTNREGIGLLREAMEEDPSQGVIVMTAYADTETYADALEAGALTYLDKKEFSPGLIARIVEATVQQSQLRKKLALAERHLDRTEPIEMIGASPGAVMVREAVLKAADNDQIPVLIIGEAGVGKKLAARNIQRLSRRRSAGPFLRAPAQRIADEDLMVRFFGHCRNLEGRRGVESRGWVDDAKSGVLLVDGITNPHSSVWSALFDMVATGNFVRRGGTSIIEADTRLVIAVTPLGGQAVHPLIDTVRARHGLVIPIPALRERPEDIPLLAQYFLQNMYRMGKTQARGFTGASLTTLEALPWPGNMRELSSAVEYAAIRSDVTGLREIRPEHLPLSYSDVPSGTSRSLSSTDYQLNLARAELSLVEFGIERFDSHAKHDLAVRLGYNDRFTFSRRVRRCLFNYPALQAEFPRAASLFNKEIKSP